MERYPHLVLLGTDSEADLEVLCRDLTVAGIEHRPFREPDMGDSLTAVATAPLGPEHRRRFRCHRLLSLHGAEEPRSHARRASGRDPMTHERGD